LTPKRLTGLLVALQTLVLVLMGRRWWCKCDQFFLWAGANGSHNSQHLADAYTGSHLQHGFLFYALAWKLFAQKSKWWRLNAALALEIVWEIWENTPFIIDRYRQDTVSLDYVGDSIVNSLGDLLACALGYGMAGFLPIVASLLLYLGIELTMLWTIRDSLTLNVIMLVAPIEQIKNWQKGA
jgi:hypothetical protein